MWASSFISLHHFRQDREWNRDVPEENHDRDQEGQHASATDGAPTEKPATQTTPWRRRSGDGIRLAGFHPASSMGFQPPNLKVASMHIPCLKGPGRKLNVSFRMACDRTLSLKPAMIPSDVDLSSVKYKESAG